MGLRTPFGYVGYELTFLNTIIHLLDHICGGCHSEDDFGGCRKCPAGQLFFASKDYIMNARPYEYDSQRNDYVAQIKGDLENIEPETSFNVSWIMQKEKSPDLLHNLRELASKLQFITEDHIRYFPLDRTLHRRVEDRMLAEYAASKSKNKKPKLPKLTKKLAGAMNNRGKLKPQRKK